MHAWRGVDGVWRCEECHTWQVGESTPAPPSRNGCKGNALLHKAAHGASLGHNILLADGEASILFCSRCGGFSHKRAIKLSRKCSPPTIAGTQALKRIANGILSWQERGRRGPKTTGLPIRRSMAFDVAAGSWIHRDNGKARRRGLQTEDGFGDGNPSVPLLNFVVWLASMQLWTHRRVPPRSSRTVQ